MVKFISAEYNISFFSSLKSSHDKLLQFLSISDSNAEPDNLLDFQVPDWPIFDLFSNAYYEMIHIANIRSKNV